MTQLEMQRRFFAPDPQPAGGVSPRDQTTIGWRGHGPRDQEKRTRRAPLREYVLVDYSRSNRHSHCEIQTTTTDRLTLRSALGVSLHRQTKGIGK